MKESAIKPDEANVTVLEPHPVVYSVLYMPCGVFVGFVWVALGYLLTNAGFSPTQIGGLIAASLFPMTWKVLWGPVIDLTLRRKQWHIIGAFLSGVGLLCLGAVPMMPDYYFVYTSAVLAASFGVSILNLATESLMAHNTSAASKGRAAGWFQGGFTTGIALGGGVGLWISQVAPWSMTGAVFCGVLCLGSTLALLYVPEPLIQPVSNGILQQVFAVLKDAWSVLRSRRGALAMLMCCLPLGTTAVGRLFSAIAGNWQASAETVALVTGLLGGIVTTVGCVVGGYLADKMNRHYAFIICSLVQGLCALSFAFAPRTEFSFIIFTLIYALITGFIYATFSAFVLEAIGRGAAATKYNLLAGPTNLTATLMTMLMTWILATWGLSAMLATEIVFAIASVGAYAVASFFFTRMGMGKEDLVMGSVS